MNLVFQWGIVTKKLIQLLRYLHIAVLAQYLAFLGQTSYVGFGWVFARKALYFVVSRLY
jgi:hypothetical protein